MIYSLQLKTEHPKHSKSSIIRLQHQFLACTLTTSHTFVVRGPRETIDCFFHAFFATFKIFRHLAAVHTCSEFHKILVSFTSLMVGLMVTETFFHKIFKGLLSRILIGERLGF